MQIDITPVKTEGLERLLEVTVPLPEVQEAEDRAAKRYASQVRLPGFRPGKAPAGMVRKKFAAAIRQEAIEGLVQAAFKEVLDREKLDLATQPHIHDLKAEDGQPLTFQLHLEIRPSIELPHTTGFKVTRTSKPVTDDQLREQVETLRDQRAAWAPVSERPLPGDMVTVQLATAEDDGTMPEGKEYRLVLGGEQAIPGIEELIMETTTGESTERPVKWPEDFPDEAQRGKTKKVRVTLTDVKRKSLPDLDDAFAREVGDFDSLDALHATVREDLSKHAEHEADSEVRQKLIDELLAANPFDVPPSWVNQLVQAYGEAYQIPESEREKFASEFRPMAVRQVRRDLVIETIAAREGLAATEADIDERVADVAKKRGAEPGQVYASLQKAGRLKELERSITEDKV
ncbi:MAG: trigger factor, partial [Gemmatimonadota bacterium]